MVRSLFSVRVLQVRLFKDARRRHLYELLRPEFVSTNPEPLSSDGLTAWGANDDLAEVHNEELRAATNRLFSVAIPQFAEFLDSLSDEACAKLRLPEELHIKGINTRHLGFVRSKSKSPIVRKKILLECVARSMKSDLQILLRKKNKELMIPSDEPYRKLTLQFFNSALARHRPFWEHIILETQRT